MANLGVLGLSVIASRMLNTRHEALGDPLPLVSIELFALAVLALTTLSHALVVRFSLSPLSKLKETARSVREGSRSSRAPPAVFADPIVDGVIGLFNTVLDDVEAERTLKSKLSSRLLQAEERERERVARDLYSGSAQTLAGVLVRLRVADRLRAPDSTVGALAEVRGEVASALDGIRTLARQLHPPELDELGVVAALDANARYLLEGRTMRVQFQGKFEESKLSRDTTLALFRILQEALANAVVHSGADSVRVYFSPEATGLVADVADDGIGFDADRPLFSGSGGLGLLGMRERAGYVGGSLAVESTPGEGTRVRLTVPWARHDAGTP